MSTLSDFLSIRCVACCGGRSDVAQMARELSKGAHVVVGTPGRVLGMRPVLFLFVKLHIGFHG